MDHLRNKKKYIVFEGIDGVGKSTQARLLYFYLKRLNIEAEVCHYPSEGLVGKLVRNLLKDNKFDSMDEKARALLTAADFYDGFSKVSKDRKIIIFDRFIHSNYVSNINLDRNWIDKIHAFAPKPDIVLYLDCDVDEIRDRKLADFGAKNIERQKEFARRYNKIFENCEHIKVNTNKSINEIHETVIKEISNLLGI